jgi:hypothetical protein
MSRSIPDELAALALGEATVLRGVRVVRRSLFGFQIAGGKEILDARAVAARVAAGARVAVARVEVCFRCAGDGLGRRDRGVCRVCHGRGISAGQPAGGWAEATPAQIAAAVDQAVLALRGARHPRARESLGALLATLAPLGGRPLGELRRAAAPPEPLPASGAPAGPGVTAA